MAYASTGGINVDISAVPFTGGACGQPGGVRLRPLRRSPRWPATTRPEHRRRQRDPRQRREGDLLRQRGHVGDWRPDAPSSRRRSRARRTAGRERSWLDIRQTWILLPIMDARVAKCRAGRVRRRRVGQRRRLLQPDRVPAHVRRTSSCTTRALANLAHHYGLTVAIKNDVEQLADLAPYFDYAVNEQCQQYSECGGYTRPSSARARPCSRSSTSCRSRSSARRRTPRTATRS